MYAVIWDKGRQEQVRVGDVIRAEFRRGAQPGEPVVFDRVLLVSDEGELRLGKPHIEGARVSGEVVGHEKGKKEIAFRFKRRKGVRVKRGHRQGYTRVRITAIDTAEAPQEPSRG